VIPHYLKTSWLWSYVLGLSLFLKIVLFMWLV